jgi:plastocyanin
VRRVIVAGVVALCCATPASGFGAANKTVKVGDNFFSPKSLTVSRATTVTWKWPGFDEAGDVHDVKLKSGPKGVKKFHSEAASTDYSYKRKLTVPGTYKIVCTLHEEMTQTIKVRK